MLEDLMARPSDPLIRRQLDALAILRTARYWRPLVGPTGKRLYLIPGSRPGAIYTVCATSCTCPDATYKNHICKHMMACRLFVGAVQAFEGHRQRSREEHTA